MGHDNHHHMDVTLQWVHLTKVVQVKDTNRSTSVKNSTITNGGTDQTLRFKKQPEDDNHKTKPSHIQPQSKIILNQVSGQAKAGEILAILMMWICNVSFQLTFVLKITRNYE